MSLHLCTISETFGAETRRSHGYPNRDSHNTCRPAQSHCRFTIGSGNPQYQDGPVHQDGHPCYIPTEQELPAVVRHLGKTGSKHTRYFTEKGYNSGFLVLYYWGAAGEHSPLLLSQLRGRTYQNKT